MYIHFLQQVPFEGPAQIAAWAADRGHRTSITRLDLGHPLPPLEAFDWLVVLGGPMNIHDEVEFPFLRAEKDLIREAIQQEKTILGLCLGAQLAADVLGSRVERMGHREIGWHDVTQLSPLSDDSPLRVLPSRFPAFHWHGDMFHTPPGGRLLARSQACPHQAFSYGDRVLGLQFHIEYDTETIRDMLTHCEEEMVPGPYVQTPEQIEAQLHLVDELRAPLFEMLDTLAARCETATT